jgi:hypothetical protein
VLVEVVLLALRRERQLPRAMLICTDLRRTFHCWPLSARFRSVVFLARRAVDRAPNHTSENGHNGQPPSGAPILHIGVLHKLLSSERQKSKLSPAGWIWEMKNTVAL